MWNFDNLEHNFFIAVISLKQSKISWIVIQTLTTYNDILAGILFNLRMKCGMFHV